MLHLEVEAQHETPPPGANAGKTRFFAFGSAALLLAGVAASQSGAFAPSKPARAESLIAVSGVPRGPRDDAMRHHQSFHPDEESAAAKAGSFAHDETMELTCGTIPQGLGLALADAEAIFRRSCSAEVTAEAIVANWWSPAAPPAPPSCDLGEDAPQSTADALNLAAKGVMEHAWAADMRECLEETMADEVVQEHAGRLRRRWNQILEGASSTAVRDWDGQESLSVRERLVRSYADIGRWRDNMVNGAGSILDRSLIFPKNVEDPDVCPAPCLRCTRDHNSIIFDNDEQLSFKCILPRRGNTPPSSDFNCSEPVRRNSLQGQITGQRKTWCDVQSWHTSHDQAVTLAANVKCGAEAILGPLRHGIEMEERVREACQSVETSQATEALVAQQYHEFVVIDDGIASPAENAAFRIFMNLGMYEGLADVRRAARGNTASAVQ